MKDDGFHRTKTKPNEKLLLLKLKNGKAYAMDGVACGDAVFSAIEMNLSSEQNNNNNRNIGTGWQ